MSAASHARRAPKGVTRALVRVMDASGRSIQEIATALDIHTETVRFHLGLKPPRPKPTRVPTFSCARCGGRALVPAGHASCPANDPILFGLVAA